MKRNKNLAKYDFRYNDLLDKAVKFFTEIFGPEKERKLFYVTEIEIS